MPTVEATIDHTYIKNIAWTKVISERLLKPTISNGELFMSLCRTLLTQFKRIRR